MLLLVSGVGSDNDRSICRSDSKKVSLLVGIYYRITVCTVDLNCGTYILNCDTHTLNCGIVADSCGICAIVVVYTGALNCGTVTKGATRTGKGTPAIQNIGTSSSCRRPLHPGVRPTMPDLTHTITSWCVESTRCRNRLLVFTSLAQFSLALRRIPFLCLKLTTKKV